MQALHPHIGATMSVAVLALPHLSPQPLACVIGFRSTAEHGLSIYEVFSFMTMTG